MLHQVMESILLRPPGGILQLICTMLKKHCFIALKQIYGFTIEMLTHFYNLWPLGQKSVIQIFDRCSGYEIMKQNVTEGSDFQHHVYVVSLTRIVSSHRSIVFKRHAFATHDSLQFSHDYQIMIASLFEKVMIIFIDKNIPASKKYSTVV